MKKLTRRMKRFKGLTVGLDLHKKFIQYSVLDARGNEVEGGRVDAKRGALLELVRRLQKRGQVRELLRHVSGERGRAMKGLYVEASQAGPDRGALAPEAGGVVWGVRDREADPEGNARHEGDHRRAGLFRTGRPAEFPRREKLRQRDRDDAQEPGHGRQAGAGRDHARRQSAVALGLHHRRGGVPAL